MLNLRMLNEGIDSGREKLFEEYRKIKSGDNGKFRLHSLDDFQELKRLTSVRRNTQSMYVKKNVGVNVREQSNGESAFMYFAQKLKKTRCTCLMSRKTACRRKNKWNWCAFWKIRRVFTAASSLLQHIHHLCFR